MAIGLLLFTSCENIGIGAEDVVKVDLPSSTNFITVESWVTNIEEIQKVRITQSNGFNSSTPVTFVTDADVIVQSRNGTTFLYTYVGEGNYHSNDPYVATASTEYRIRIQLENGDEIRSDWEEMPEMIPLNGLIVASFEENDPNNPGQQFSVFYPRTIAVDPGDSDNYYRWKFYRNGEPYLAPEPITIQDDRFFNGNIIPNNFSEFAYETNDEMIVEFQSISKSSFNYLNLLKSQITSLGTSSGTTPAQVEGNLMFQNPDENKAVLGFFGATAISSDTTIVNN